MALTEAGLRSAGRCGVALTELADWLAAPDPARFPHDAVRDEILRFGKHFAAPELLEALARASRVVAQLDGDEDAALLREYLRTVLDKWDGTYDYPSYTALAVLALWPACADSGVHPPDLAGQRAARRDRLVAALLADLCEFELTVADGRTDLLPEMRPDAGTVARRLRLATRAAAPVLRRLHVDVGVDGDGAADAVARRMCEAVGALLTPFERRILRASMLPVYVAHDEYVFIRLLQLFESTFALITVQLRSAVSALASADGASTVDLLDRATGVITEASPLFPVLGTMQVEAFRTFRQFTEGASAIQSRDYKAIEALCRRPDPERLASVAYLSVPEVRAQVLAGDMTLDGMFEWASTSGSLDQPDVDRVAAAMGRFAAALLRWRRTHYGLAVRMLGERRGTGYTEGPPYLKAVATVPVFRSLSPLREGDRAEPV